MERGGNHKTSREKKLIRYNMAEEEKRSNVERESIEEQIN